MLGMTNECRAKARKIFDKNRMGLVVEMQIRERAKLTVPQKDKSKPLRTPNSTTKESTATNTNASTSTTATKELPAFWNLLQRSFVSTLTHELFHVLGFEHVDDVNEILCPKRGGIYARNPNAPDISTCVLKSSPKTRSASIWLYGEQVEERKKKFNGGVPIHCCSCYQLGWMWNLKGSNGDGNGQNPRKTNNNSTNKDDANAKSSKPILNKHM